MLSVINLEFVTPHTIYNFMHESSGASWQHALDSWTNSFEYKEDMRFWETFYFERILLRGQLWVLPVVGQVALYCVPVFSYYDKKVLETYLALPLENCIDRRAHTLACALNMPSGSRIRVTGALPVPPKIVAEYPILQTTFQLAREFYHYIDRFRNRLPIREEERRSLFDHKAILNHLPDHIFQHDYIIMDVLTGRTPCNYRVIRKLFAIAAFHCHFIAGDSVNWPYPRKLYQPRITEIRHGPRPYKNDKGGLYEPK